MPATSVRTAIQANLAVIQQGTALLASLSDAHYSTPLPMIYNASIGGHIRHIVDHYLMLLNGLEAARVAYEHRERDPRVENDRSFAIAHLEMIANRLSLLELVDLDRALRYEVETNGEGGAAGTSLVRELEFLLSHTVHHYALVAVMARLLGYEPAADFGVAPSTLRHQQRQLATACAR